MHSHDHRLGPSHDGSVVLDIGGDTGALVLHTDERLLGRELEIECLSEDRPRTHTAVRARELGTGRFFAAVYPSVQKGRYRLIATGQEFDIEGARVTEVAFTS